MNEERVRLTVVEFTILDVLMHGRRNGLSRLSIRLLTQNDHLPRSVINQMRTAARGLGNGALVEWFNDDEFGLTKAGVQQYEHMMKGDPPTIIGALFFLSSDRSPQGAVH